MRMLWRDQASRIDHQLSGLSEAQIRRHDAFWDYVLLASHWATSADDQVLVLGRQLISVKVVEAAGGLVNDVDCRRMLNDNHVGEQAS